MEFLNKQKNLKTQYVLPSLYQATNGSRTRDLRITNATLYQLSYSSITLYSFVPTHWSALT